MDKDFVKPVLDLGANRRGELNEFIITAFKSWAKMLLGDLFQGNTPPPVVVRGSQAEVEAFTDALKRETEYMRAWKANKLDSPETYRITSERDKAIKNFEKATGLKWIFD